MNTQIENWNELTDEQKEKATAILQNQLKLKVDKNNSAAKFFEKNGYIKINNFIDINMANLLYYHVKLEAQRLCYIENNDLDIEDEKLHYGTFFDEQAPGDFSKYGDPIFDALLGIGLEKVEDLTGKKLVPTYSYHRLYTNGSELKRHIDRPSCEISTSLCLGYDISNVDQNKYPDYNWPMFVGSKIGESDTDGIPVCLKPGDMIIYRGDIIEHWREPFVGNNHAQVFLHYNEKEGQYNVLNDGRPLLGFTSKFRSEESKLLQEKKDLRYENFSSNKKVIY